METRAATMIHKVNDSSLSVFIGATLVLLAVASRLMPHPPNIAGVAAVAVFAGMILPRKVALTLPLVAMVVSDLILGLHPLILFTWGSFILTALLSSYFMKRVNASTVVISSIGASVLFYFVSNFGVWLEGRLYARTFSGLVECYVNALP